MKWLNFADIKQGVIQGMVSANERRRYILTSALIGWTHTENEPFKPNNTTNRVNNSVREWYTRKENWVTFLE